MGYEHLFFSLLFFVAFAIYLYFGIHTLFKNPGQILNRLFFTINISLAIWSFGFASGNSISNLETALLWRRFSALGWTSVYGLLLHFILVLSKENAQFNSKFYYLLHIPGLINMYVFSISGKMAAYQHNLVMTVHGNINLSVNNSWDIFFYIYYISYSLIVLGLLSKWKKTTSDKESYRQAAIIFNAILATLILGTFTDVILGAMLGKPIPQIGPILTLIPIGGIYYSMKDSNLMSEDIEDNDELILTHLAVGKIYYYLALAFLSGGLLSFLSYFFSHLIEGEANLQYTLLSGGILFGFGCIILMLQLIKGRKLRSYIVITVSLLSIPVITLRFIQFASVTVWAFPMILIIVALVLNERIPLILVTLVSILTQIIVWIYAPQEPLPMDRFDYIIRMGMFLIAFWIGLIVNDIYIKRLKENIYQKNFQKNISEISFDFLTVCQNTLDEKIGNILTKTGEFFDVDRSYIFLFDHKMNSMTYVHEWKNQGIESKMNKGETISLDTYRWWIKEVKTKKLINIRSINDLPDEADTEKKALIRQGNKSVLVVPIGEKENFLGFIGLDSVRTFKEWTGYHVGLLRILSNILADGLIRIEREKEIEHMAYYDYLTGLAKRPFFMKQLDELIHESRIKNRIFALMYMDLDSFKTINDIAGHATGDLILEKVASNLEASSRENNLVARFDGDEFLALITDVNDINEIKTVVRELMGVFKKPTSILDRDFYVSSSAGIVIYPDDGLDGETLVKNAQIALEKAKSRGKSQYSFYTEDMKVEVEKKSILSKNLYWALERNELDIYYQPQIKLSTGEIIGLEALLRWKHPELGMISPGIFIPLAEQTGLINNMGDWVLREASKQAKIWQDMGLGPIRIAVNLSVLQFNNPNIVRNVGDILNETGLNPEYLELEITENIAIEEERYTLDILNRLKKLGVSISIDDFGTAYSSLSRLKSLPIDRIKIDMQFVQAIENSEKDQAIVQVIINLARSLGLGVLAEGVETKSQLEFLNQKNCDDVQGYYYYRPMPVNEIEEILQATAENV